MASHGHPNKLTELHLWRFKLEMLKSDTPVGTQKPDIQMQTFLTWDYYFVMLLFLSEKYQNLFDIQEHCICKLGKIRSELKLLFGVYY